MDFEITPYRPADQPDLDEVCIRTGDSGQDATGKYAHPELLHVFYLYPYLVHVPELTLVLRGVSDGRAYGYVTGTADTASFEEWLRQVWLPPLAARYPLGSTPEPLWGEGIIRQLHAPGRSDPRLLADYPAHLHIDLLPVAQGGGWGRRIMREFLSGLRARDVPGIHLGVGVRNQQAIGFYEHLGFATLRTHEWGRTMGMRLT